MKTTEFHIHWLLSSNSHPLPPAHPRVTISFNLSHEKPVMKVKIYSPSPYNLHWWTIRNLYQFTQDKNIRKNTSAFQTNKDLTDLSCTQSPVISSFSSPVQNQAVMLSWRAQPLILHPFLPFLHHTHTQGEDQCRARNAKTTSDSKAAKL